MPSKPTARRSTLRSVVAAVKRDLQALPPELAESGLAASALTLARQLDHPKVPANQKATCARALHEALRELRSLAPPKQERSKLDDLTARRQARLARGADAAS